MTEWLKWYFEDGTTLESIFKNSIDNKSSKQRTRGTINQGFNSITLGVIDWSNIKNYYIKNCIEIKLQINIAI